MQKIYLDNASTTRISGEVLNEMLPVFADVYGNSSSLHSFGRDSMALVDNARDRIARTINATRSEIFFTSGGTEANNWAIIGLAKALESKGRHIITSKIEHPSILNACKKLEEEGFRVSYLNVNETGLVDLGELLHEIDDETILVSIMAANNEIGTIQNIKTIAQLAHEKDIVFHTDASQALGSFRIDVNDLGIDAMTMSAHKIGGPKGIGALYLKKGLSIEPIIVGGEQERGKRAGTLNTPAIVGFGKACELVTFNYILDNRKLKTIRDYFVSKVMEEIENVSINGHLHQRLPGLVSLSFASVDGEALMCLLDLSGIAVSTGAACSTGSVEPSHVILALGKTVEEAKSTVRFSFSTSNTKDEIDYVVDVLKKSVARLRNLSPIRPSKDKDKGDVENV